MINKETRRKNCDINPPPPEDGPFKGGSLESGFSLKCTHRSRGSFVASRGKTVLQFICRVFENLPLGAVTKSFLVIRVF